MYTSPGYTHLYLLLLGIHLKEPKAADNRDTCIPMFIVALFRIAKSCNWPRHSSMYEWIKKMWYIYTMDYYSAIKINEICHLQENG
jgi:hypothetical protein